MRVTPLLQQAQEKLRAGEVDQAADLFVEVCTQDPEAVEALVGLAQASLLVNAPESERFTAAALAVNPDRVDVQTVCGVMHEAKRDLPAAISCYARATELDASSFLAHYNLGRALAAGGAAKEAVPVLTRAVALEPRSFDALYALGVARSDAGDLDGAIGTLHEAKFAAPANPDAYATLADLLVRVPNLEGARDALDEGLRQTEEHPVLLVKAVAVAMGRGDFRAAASHAERCVAKAPDVEQGWINLATLCAATGALERSESAAKDGLRLHPTSWQLHQHLGNLYETAKLDADAETHYRRAVALAPGEWKPRMNLGALLTQMDVATNHREAIQALEKAASLAPDGEWQIQYDLALAHFRVKELEEALELCDHVIESAPPDDPAVKLARTLRKTLGERFDVTLTQVLASGHGDGGTKYDPSLLDFKKDLDRTGFRFFTNAGSARKSCGPNEKAIFPLSADPGFKLVVAPRAAEEKVLLAISMLDAEGTKVFAAELELEDGGFAFPGHELDAKQGHLFLAIGVTMT